MRKNWKGRKDMALRLIICVVAILIVVGYIPVKHTVYAEKNDDRRDTKYGLFAWYEKEIDDSGCIIETSSLSDRPKLKESGINYIGEDDANYTPVYYEAQGKSPILKLNSNFDADKVKNYFAIRYFDCYWLEEGQGEMKDGYYIQPIVIKDWAPVYPIKRSGWLASKLLPKSYLTIWDYIG